jgi:hypothetical protein
MTAVDPSRCPLCGEPNRCAMEVARKTGSPVEACWCMSAEFLPGVLDMVPAPARGVACVCAFCAAGAPVPAPDVQAPDTQD